MAWTFKAAAALALAATGAAVPMQAQAAGHCWNVREMQAEHVRQMQTMLMVAALRCRAAHIDISADYDGFVVAQKDAIAQANLVIKQHIADAGGTQTDYDRFATTLANGYGDGPTTEASCAEAAALAHDGAAAAPSQLESLAAARLFPVALAEGTCEAPAAPVLMARAEQAEPGPIASPEAAMVMIARERGGGYWAAPGERTPVMAQAPMMRAPAAPAPVATAQAEPLPPLLQLAAPPAEEPRAVSLPADVVAAMTVLARYQASQSAPATGAPSAVQVATAH